MTAPSSSSPRGKPVTRRTMLSRRDALSSGERERLSADIAARALVELAGHRIVALYAAKGSEVDTAALDAALRATGVTVAYPRITEGSRVLAFYASEPPALASSRFGLREPVDLAANRVALAEIGAYCIPGLAFDRTGWRLGWGHGYYDTTLAAAPDALRLGLAFDCQVTDSVDHDAHDARLHLVVTETATYRAS